MNATLDAPDDWTTLAAEWQEAAPPVAADAEALRVRVDADRQRMRWFLAADVAVSLLAIAATIATVRSYPGSWSRFVAIDTTAMLVAMWAFAMWNARGTWRPLGQTTEAFLGLTRLRCMRRLRALSYATIITVLQVVAVLWWSRTPNASEGGPNLPGLALLVPATVIIVVIAAIVSSRRRIGRQLRKLDALAAELLP